MTTEKKNQTPVPTKHDSRPDVRIPDGVTLDPSRSKDPSGKWADYITGRTDERPKHER